MISNESFIENADLIISQNELKENHIIMIRTNPYPAEPEFIFFFFFLNTVDPDQLASDEAI